MVANVTAGRYSTGYFQGRKTQLLISPSVSQDCRISATRNIYFLNKGIPISIVDKSPALSGPYENYGIGSNTTHNLLQLVYG